MGKFRGKMSVERKTEMRCRKASTDRRESVQMPKHTSMPTE